MMIPARNQSSFERCLQLLLTGVSSSMRAKSSLKSSILGERSAKLGETKPLKSDGGDAGVPGGERPGVRRPSSGLRCYAR